MLTECSKERGACQGCGLGPQIPGELGVGEGGGHCVIEHCPGDHQEASFYSTRSQGCFQNQDLKKQSPLAHAGILLNQQAGRTTNEPRILSLQLGPGSKRGLLRPSSPTLLRASLPNWSLLPEPPAPPFQLTTLQPEEGGHITGTVSLSGPRCFCGSLLSRLVYVS